MFLLCMAWLISTTVADIPENFQVSLFRDAHFQLLVSGTLFLRGDNETRVVNTSVSTRCGMLNMYGEHFLSLKGQGGIRAMVDVTDTFWESSILVQSLCLGHRSALSRSVESVAYINSLGNESLIFRPSNISELSLFGDIAYTEMDPLDTTTLGRTSASDSGDLSVTGDPNEIDQLIFAIHSLSPSTIQPRTFVQLQSSIRSTDALIQSREDGVSEIRLPNCYEHLLSVLPDLNYHLINDRTPTTRITFSPAEYLIATSDNDVCELQVAPADYYSPLQLSGHLIRRIGGIHFDYANRRIGIFDPL